MHERAVCVVLWLPRLPVDVRAVSPQPCFSLRRGRRRGRPHRSTIARLPSGASISRRRSSPQRPLGLRGRYDARWHVCGTAAGGIPPLLRRSSAFDPARAIHPRIRRAGLGRGYPPVTLRRRLAASGAHRRRIRSGPVAGTPSSLPAIGRARSTSGPSLSYGASSSLRLTVAVIECRCVPGVACVRSICRLCKHLSVTV